MLRNLLSRLFWWWGFWRKRLPARYATGKQLNAADDRVRAARAYIAHLLNNAMYPRRDHRDLLTGMVVALTHGPWPRRDSRPGEWLKKRSGLRRDTPRKVVGRPSVYVHKNRVKVGMTEFVPEYVPRAEALAARRA